jgi:hypothetical protein
MNDDTRNLQHDIDRHEEAINQDTKEIERLKKSHALIVKALDIIPAIIPPSPISIGPDAEQRASARGQLTRIVSDLKSL